MRYIHASSHRVTSWPETWGGDHPRPLSDSPRVRQNASRRLGSQERRGNRHDVLGELQFAVFITADKINAAEQGATISGMPTTRGPRRRRRGCVYAPPSSFRAQQRAVCRDSSGTWRARDSSSRKLLRLINGEVYAIVRERASGSRTEVFALNAAY